MLYLHPTFCSYPKVAILPLNFKRRTAFQIYDKLSYEERTRHFWVGAVKGWRIIATLFYDSLLCCFESANLISYSTKHLTLNSENEFLGRDIAKQRKKAHNYFSQKKRPKSLLFSFKLLFIVS